MEGFETIIRTLLVQDGYWVLDGYKVALSKEEKAAVDRPSAPRWEIDLLAYKGRDNRAFAIECKSYLDSGGVDFASMQPGSRYAGRYKLFNEPQLRSVVLHRIREQLVRDALTPAGVSVTLGLAAGCVYSPADDERIKRWFDQEGWWYLSPRWIADRLRALASTSYFNDVAIMATKLLERNPRPNGQPAGPGGGPADHPPAVSPGRNKPTSSRG